MKDQGTRARLASEIESKLFWSQIVLEMDMEGVIMFVVCKHARDEAAAAAANA